MRDYGPRTCSVSSAWGKIFMKTLTSPPCLRLCSGMQIFVKHQHAFGLQHPKGVTLHLVLRLRSGMQIFVSSTSTLSDYNIQKKSPPCSSSAQWNADFCQAPAHFRITTSKRSHHLVLRLRWGRSLTSPPRSSSALWNADFCQAPAHFWITTSKRSHHLVLHLHQGRSLTSPLLLHLILHLCGGMQIFVSSTSMHGPFPPLLHLPLYAL